MTAGTPPGDREASLAQLAALLASSPHNLVARSQRGQLREAHLGEAEALAVALDAHAGQRWMDLGTGGGLPGLVLALCLPDVGFTLVDSVGKKAREAARFAAALGLRNVQIVTARAEDLARAPEHRGTYDGVVSRALATLVVVAELSRGFCRPGGVVVAVKGPRYTEELPPPSALKALALTDPQAERLASTPRATWVVRMHAVGPPPEGVPRAVGVPQRAPLGLEAP